VQLTLNRAASPNSYKFKSIMKRLLKRLAFVALLAISFHRLAAATWEQVWSDEFNVPDINRSNWTYDTGGDGWGNKELEYYTSRAQNSYVTNDTTYGSCLVIEARKEQFKNRSYTSARLKTQGLQHWTYGKVEARIRIPRGQGIWPAFWMLGEDITTVGWPGCGEIDIMENIGREPNIVHGTVHGPGYSGENGKSGATTLASGAFADNFHVYAVEWGPDRIEWFVDGTSYFSVIPGSLSGPWVFNHNFFLILNVAVGGSWPGSPTATTVFPQQMWVDYVRVYRDTSLPPPSGDTMHVADLAMGINASGPSWQATATVRVVDGQGQLVSGATVTGQWSGLVSGGNTSFVTDASGMAGPFYSQKTRASGTIRFCVGGITKSGATYVPTANVESCDSSTH
jgi:beta-glucanase (GH16 family)